MRGMPAANLSTACLALTLLAGCTPQDSQQPGAEPPGDASSSASVARSAASATAARNEEAAPISLARGRELYARQCAACHGATGHGDGAASYLLYPRPRDLVAGHYRIVSTWEGRPTDDDLLRTITRGMPGSAMPSWGHLPETDRRSLVAFVKSLAAEPIAVATDAIPPVDGAPGHGLITPPPEPVFDEAARARALDLFAQACASCHGPTGRGDGSQEQADVEGLPIRPRDLTAGVFKGDPSPASVYRRIVAGIPGSPMPASDWAHGDDAWHLTHLIRNWSSDTQRARMEMRPFTITAARVDRLPEHPDAGTWSAAEPVDLHLMPLWWRAERPEELTVRALHDGTDLALLLVWTDSTHDATAMRPQDFRDAVAVQLSTEPDPPFFAMGERGRPVNIWMWKSERQADLEPAFQDLEKVYPNLGIDSYPNLIKSPLEQPHRHALTLESDPTFVSAWGAGNIVADPRRASAIEDLVAQGFGTLRARLPARSTGKPGVDGRGTWDKNSYRVMFRRPLAVGPDALPLEPGSAAPIAFAVWDGHAGDRNGQKSLTIWQRLELAK